MKTPPAPLTCPATARDGKTARLWAGFRSLGVVLGCAVAGSAVWSQTAAMPASTWIYIGPGGIKTFSDVAPPAGTPDSKILMRPGGIFDASAPARTAASAAESTTSAVQGRVAKAAASGRGTDAELDKRLKDKEATEKAAELAALDAEEKKQRARMREACTNMRGAYNALNADTRITTINNQGERVVMDDAQRSQMLQKTRENLAECDKNP